MFLRTLLLIALVSQQFLFAYSQRNQGVISKITDGDSFEVIADGEKFNIRLNGIDCPEPNQPFGKEATDFIHQFLYRQIEYVSHGPDRYNRVLADVYVNGIMLNSLLIEKGLAWHYKAYSTDPALAGKELEARTSKTGLWSQQNPVAPWEWRKQNRTYNDIIYSTPSFTAPSSYDYSNTTAPQQDSGATVIICGGQYAKKYHRSSSCRGLRNCKGEIYSSTKSQAIGMGRSPCAICY